MSGQIDHDSGAGEIEIPEAELQRDAPVPRARLRFVGWKLAEPFDDVSFGRRAEHPANLPVLQSEPRSFADLLFGDGDVGTSDPRRLHDDSLCQIHDGSNSEVPVVLVEKDDRVPADLDPPILSL